MSKRKFLVKVLMKHNPFFAHCRPQHSISISTLFIFSQIIDYCKSSLFQIQQKMYVVRINYGRFCFSFFKLFHTFFIFLTFLSFYVLTTNLATNTLMYPKTSQNTVCVSGFCSKVQQFCMS